MTSVNGDVLPAENRLLFREAVNLWGTTDPWRQDAIELLMEAGVWESRWYDPLAGPQDIHHEVYSALANRNDTVVINGHTPGKLSKLELGHTMIKAVCGGTEAHIRVNSLAGDDERAVRARKLIMTALDQMRLLLPAELVQVIDPTSSAAEQQWSLHAWLRRIGSRVVGSQQSGLEWVKTTPPSLEAQPLGLQQAFLSGTSVASSLAKDAFKAEAARRGLAVIDSYTGARFTDSDMEAEYAALRESQVSAVMITNDNQTIAGAAEAPIRAALAAMNLNRRSHSGAPLPQAFGLFMEEPDKDKLSQSAFELRQALRLHIRAIRQRFPNAIYVASSPQDLAAWAARQIT